MNVERMLEQLAERDERIKKQAQVIEDLREREKYDRRAIKELRAENMDLRMRLHKQMDQGRRNMDHG